MAIYPADRENLTPDEFLHRCATFDIDCRRVGNKVWIHTHVSTRARTGDSISSDEVVEFVLHELLYNGEPCLRFVQSKRDPGIVALAWTPAGKLSKFYHNEWVRHVRARTPRRLRRRLATA